jgi:hypothetical protein
MHILTLEDAVALLLGHSRYAGSRVWADKVVRTLAVLIRVPRKAYKAAIAARNDHHDEVIDAEALLDYTLEAFKELVLDLGRQALSEYGSRTHADHLWLFASKSPSDINETPVDDRDDVFESLVDRTTTARFPAALKPAGKALATALGEIKAAKAAVKAAKKLEEELVVRESEAKQAVVTGYIRLHAQLTDRFPNDPAKVEKYFKKVAAPKKKAKPAPGEGGTGAGTA